MKYFFIVLAFISLNVWAEWDFVVEDGGNNQFIDRQTIRREGSYVKVWELQNLKVKFRNALSFRSRNEYDCKNEKYRILSLSVFSEHFARGELLHSDTDSDAWRDVPPQTAAEVFYKTVCKK